MEMVDIIEKNGYIITKSEKTTQELNMPESKEKAYKILNDIVVILNQNYYLDKVTVNEIKKLF